jgi:hypothetical protein
VAAVECDLVRAQKFITSAILAMEGFEVPLAAWRVHATASEIFERMQKRDQAMRHRELSRATIERLADSLPDKSPLRKIFLSAPAIVPILGEPKVYAAAD